jgi:hypothetical protein
MPKTRNVDPIDTILDRICSGLKVGMVIYAFFAIFTLTRVIDFDLGSRSLPRDHICSNIESATSNISEILIHLKRKIKPSNPLHLSSHFGFWTSAFDLPLLMPPGSAHKARMDNLTLIFEFPLPFISPYSGSLFCVDTIKYDPPPFQLPQFNETFVIAQYPLNLSIPQFRENYAESQMFCHGNRSENRWCETRHIALATGHLVIQTQAHFSFPAAFVSLGGRAPPFDPLEERIDHEPLLTNQNIAELSIGVSAIGETAVLFGLGPQAQNGSLILDFLLPAYMTIDRLIDRPLDRRLRFFVNTEVDQAFADLVQVLTIDPPALLPKTAGLTLFERAVIGLEKADDICDGARSQLARFGHIYGFPDGSAKSMRIGMIEKFGIAESAKTVVTFLDTENTELGIANLEPLRQMVARTCSDCEVRTVNVDGREGGPIVRQVAASKVLIGRSGVGLEHTVWLPRGGIVIELRPFMYWCNDRFEMAARAAGAKYFDVMNTGRVKPNYKTRRYGREERECQSTRNYCESWQCHSLLFGQPVDVELETFNATWERVLGELGDR